MKRQRLLSPFGGMCALLGVFVLASASCGSPVEDDQSSSPASSPLGQSETATTLLMHGRTNRCPSIEKATATPADGAVGSSMKLSGRAHDADRGPAPLSYAWSGTSGTFSDAATASPSFRCAAPGTVTLTLTVSDGDPACAISATLPVTCSPAVPSATAIDRNWANWPVPPVNSGPADADPVTGLMWGISSIGGTVDRASAGAYCAGIGERGHADWRLPTEIELLSVVDFSVTGGVFHQAFYSSPVFTATPVAGSAGDSWSIGWYNGSPAPSSPDQGPVLCVRSDDTVGNGSTNHFTYVDGSGVVTDSATKLVWQRTAPAQTFSLADARAYCASPEVSDALGEGGWRLPNVKELWTLVDFVHSATPVTDQAAFPGTAADFFWTTTDYADGPSSGPVSAWAIDFSSGQGSPQLFEGQHYVRCVR